MTSGAGQFVDDAGRRLACWGVAASPMKNEVESGDACLLHASADRIAVAVIDGAGHGAEAASAARQAEAILGSHLGESPISLMLRCHEGLRRTRGVVMTVAHCHLKDDTVTWLGVGNVDAVLFHGANEPRTTDRIVLRGGVVGYQLPALRTDVVPLRPCDTLIIATDGIEEHFADNVALGGEPQDIANRILAAHRKDTDDALVVVVRYLGSGRDRS